MLLYSISIAIALLFNGCADKQPQEAKVVYVPQKCIIPAVEEPVIDNNSYTNSKDIVAKAILNYEAIKEYAKKLLASQEVCK
jgi:hypothetical protein